MDTSFHNTIEYVKDTLQRSISFKLKEQEHHTSCDEKKLLITSSKKIFINPLQDNNFQVV